ncbi:TpnR [Pseudomonas aeruginosa VRFPA02]|nr:TpnR [Pseudomonas aeruginosa VRFPA02]
MFTDKASGKDTRRPELERLLAFVREGDTVVVHSMDRLARNLDDLRRLVQGLTQRGVRIEFLNRLLKYSPACGLNPPALARLFRQFPHLEIQHSIRPVFCLSRPISRLFFPHTRPCRRICPRLRSRVRL